MDSSDVIQLIILLVLLFLSAFFSSAETAMTTVNRIRIRSLADNGDARAKTLLKITDDPAKFLMTAGLHSWQQPQLPSLLHDLPLKACHEVLDYHALLYRGIEGIHVNMYNLSLRHCLELAEQTTSPFFSTLLRSVTYC